MRFVFGFIEDNEDTPSWVIRQLLEQNGSSIKDIAEKLGTSVQYVWQCLNGKKSIRVESEVAKILKQEPNKLWPNRYPSVAKVG